MFDTDSKPNYNVLEETVQCFWDENDIFNKLLEKNKGGKAWLFLDGPVTANNRLGVHHGWGRTYKDIFNRYHAMKGERLRWQNGFDCHGLWVEVEVEKALHYRNKQDITIDIERFVQACMKRVNSYIDVITQQSIRLGQWNRWDDSYRTDSTKNIESIWRFLKVCAERGLLKQGYRVMPWCTRCGTSLSQHEMADSYEYRRDTAIYFLCPLVAHPGESMLVWTTTPWTVPANVALAIHPNLTYCCIATACGHIWVSKNYKDKFYPDVESVSESPGWGFLKASYHPPHMVQPQNEYRIIPNDKIDPEQGTGIVHIAPGCGAEDYELKKENNLRAFIPTDENGLFNKECGEAFHGMHWQKVNQKVVSLMEEAGILVAKRDHPHRYPHCWRCHEPLIFRLCKEWFILTDPIRERLIEIASDIAWKPDYIGQHMENWLRNMGDWCISRRRFWGLPLPIYACCGHLTVVGSLEELRSLAVNPAELDAMPHPHLPWIDRVEIRCKHCHNPVKRVQEVGDCWLDAGIVPFSTTDKFPNDFVTEMREQVRLWFYATLLMSVVLEDKAPYKTVMTYDEMRDGNGEKFSKTKGNAPHLDKMIEEYGADPLRYAFATAPTDSIFMFGEQSIKKGKKFLNMLWNCWSFFATNANNDMPMPLGDPVQTSGVLNRWLLAQLNQTISDVTRCLDDYDAQGATFAIENFVSDLSTWYIRLQRPLFAVEDGWKTKHDSYNVLWTSFRYLAQLMAPIMPFTAEALWQKIRKYDHNLAESVFLWHWPKPNEHWDAEVELCKEMDLVRDIVQVGLAIRNGAKIKVRQPLHSLIIDGLKHNSLTPGLTDLIMQELNVEGIIYEPLQMTMMTEENMGKPWGDGVEGGIAKCTCHELKLGLNLNLTDRLREKGAVREIVRAIQDQRKKMGLVKTDKVALCFLGDINNYAVVQGNRKEIDWKCGIQETCEYKTRDGDGWFEVDVLGPELPLKLRKNS